MRQRAIGEKIISPKPSSPGGVKPLELIVSKIKYKGADTACFNLAFSFLHLTIISSVLQNKYHFQYS